MIGDKLPLPLGEGWGEGVAEEQEEKTPSILFSRSLRQRKRKKSLGSRRQALTPSLSQRRGRFGMDHLQLLGTVRSTLPLPLHGPFAIVRLAKFSTIYA